jgi:hypothetical protein
MDVTKDVTGDVERLLLALEGEMLQHGLQLVLLQKRPQTFLTVSVTVFLLYKNRRGFIHADVSRLFHSTYHQKFRKPLIRKDRRLFYCRVRPRCCVKVQHMAMPRGAELHT